MKMMLLMMMVMMNVGIMVEMRLMVVVMVVVGMRVQVEMVVGTWVMGWGIDLAPCTSGCDSRKHQTVMRGGG